MINAEENKTKMLVSKSLVSHEEKTYKQERWKSRTEENKIVKLSCKEEEEEKFQWHSRENGWRSEIYMWAKSNFTLAALSFHVHATHDLDCNNLNCDLLLSDRSVMRRSASAAKFRSFSELNVLHKMHKEYLHKAVYKRRSIKVQIRREWKK